MNELTTTKQEQTTVIAPTIDFKQTAVKYLSSMGSNLNDQQKEQFIEIACAYGLNPFKREIYGVSYEGKNGTSFNVIVGYEVYLKRAERTGLLDGWNVAIEGQGEEMKAVITIHRKDWSRPFTHEVYLVEASSGKAQWVTQPRFMLKKTAIGQGFRLCFPDELGGLPYLEEELSSANLDEEVKPIEKQPNVLATGNEVFANTNNDF